LTQRAKIEKFDVFRGNFPNTNYKWLTRPNPDQQFFDPDPSLKLVEIDPDLSILLTCL